ncbi:MAG: hypothetical protein HY040_26035 [Planctomycetes bacterium]|nr:hypothetical protein [Planctomycetota bacterium]
MHTEVVVRNRISVALFVGALALVGAQPFVLPGLGQQILKPRVEVDPYPMPDDLRNVDLIQQNRVAADRKSAGCIACHEHAHDPHFPPVDKPVRTFHLGCVDCHGGDPNAGCKEIAHVRPRFPDAWKSSANPVRSYALLNHEAPEFIRFVNPGDLRIAHIACGNCHRKEVEQNRMSMMTHGCMLWGSALYNNGAYPIKRARFGESYSMHGVPQRLQTIPPPNEYEIKKKGVLPYLDPLPRFEMSQPSNILRIFERGGRFRPEIGIPEREEESGRPRTRLSVRGLGTENRTDPVFVSLLRTRLLDPTLNFLGTNDHPGDYRSSGCTACHVVYANDRSPVHSGPYARFGNLGLSRNPDPTIPQDERGHPIHHAFTRAIPSSQCIVCHIHPGTTVMNSYLGYMWWDEESDGEFMYPKNQKNPTAEEWTRAAMNNPDEASARGLWSDPAFLDKVWELNPQLKHNQFADFHGHGWVFRAVWKKDRQGNYLDHKGKVLTDVGTPDLMDAVKMPEQIQAELRSTVRNDRLEQCPQSKIKRDGVPVHLMDIHLEKGMHCVDCHFIQDVHGNSKLYGEVRAAIEIQCIDCHGTVTKKATLRTSGPASEEPSQLNKEGGRDLKTLRTPFGKRRFEWRGGLLVQNSMVDKDLAWVVKQTKDVITEGHPHYNEKASLAKTVRFEAAKSDKMVWGAVPKKADGEYDENACAHNQKNMSCIACHSSWNPSCFGCHLPQKANKRMPGLHNDGEVTRNYVAYNFQTLRDDVFMLAKDGDVTGNRTGPARSSCAIHVGSYNGNRDNIYIQQQTISSDGPSGIAFSSNVPHTVRGGPPVDKLGKPLDPATAYLPGRSETRSCTDCHVSKNNDNNAILAQLLMHGTGYVNFIGRFSWVAAGEHGLHAVIVTEQEEPQAVIGSNLQKLAFPNNFAKFEKHGRKLEFAHEHPGIDIGEKLKHPRTKAEILQVQNRGEYLYAACGEGGLRVFDIAFIDNKSFSERITTAPVSPIGQKFYVKTAYAAGVAAPCTPAPDPTRNQNPDNEEPKIHGLFGYIYVADKCEGLILVGAATTIDGNPTNNFLKRDVTFNPDDMLKGACAVTIVGTYAYVTCDAGLAVVSIDNPKEPKITTIVRMDHAHAVATQFRYAYVCAEDGIHVLDITDMARPMPIAILPMEDAHSIYLARTYAYVAAGKRGLVILNIENAARPKIDQVYTAGGRINDLHDVKLGITYVSEFAYLADGKNGLRVVQLTSPDTPGNIGFSPRPTPQLIATYPIPEGGHALSIARGLDRDRAVDESGNQIGVFGRVGARPLNLEEQRRMFLHNGRLWTVSDDPADREYHRVK